MEEGQINEIYQEAMRKPEYGYIQEFADQIIKQQIQFYTYMAVDWETKYKKLKEKVNEYNEKTKREKLNNRNT